MDEHPDVNTNRTLILVAKCLQNLSNLVEFSATSKEEYMACMNPFVMQNLPRMKSFIDELASAPVATEPTKAQAVPFSLEKELASIYRHLKRNIDKMSELCPVEEKVVIEKLAVVLDRLQQAESAEQTKLLQISQRPVVVQ